MLQVAMPAKADIPFSGNQKIEFVAD